MKTNWENVTNPYRNEIVFENRNKAYGAYVLRREHSRNTIAAFAASTAFLGVLILVPLLKSMNQVPLKLDKGMESFEVILSDIIQEKVIVPKPVSPPGSPPPAQKTIAHVVPVVIPDNLMTETLLPPVNDNLTGNATAAATSDSGLISEHVILPGPSPSAGSDAIHVSVEEMPSFPGGLEALRDFIISNVRYPGKARAENISGTVYITFVVGKDGKIYNPEILHGLGYGIDEEAMRLVKLMPDWRPGRQQGESVNVSLNLPIRFSLR